MPRDLIVGTAGHIDHGKTSLIYALTGIDCDRLPEEKARGITIELGFAKLDLGDFHLGIVDVPGHERFIRNMLAGATGIDLALLVVAADDGIMPQTREHLEILRLLALRFGVIAITKSDLVSPDRLQQVQDEIRELVKGSFLDQSAIIATSVRSSQGLDELRNTLRSLCEQIPEPEDAGWFHLAIDRVFSRPGHGTIVTGSAISGIVHVGEELEWFPRNERVRVRSLQNHDQPSDGVSRGRRGALNLPGIALDAIHRGDELATPGILKPSKWLTVEVRALPSLKRGLRHRLPVRVHLGTTEVMGTLALLDCDRLEPGRVAFAQLILESAVVATWGRPFVLRDASAEHTLAGGRVLQPSPMKIRRQHMETILRIERLIGDDAMVRANEAAWFLGGNGVTALDLVRDAGVSVGEANRLIDQLIADRKLDVLSIASRSQRIFSSEWVAFAQEKLESTLVRLHESQPLVSAHPVSAVVSAVAFLAADEVLIALIDHLRSTGRFVGDPQRVAHVDFKPKLSPNQRKLKDRIIAAYRDAGFQPPDAKSFIAIAGGLASSLSDLFAVSVAEGELIELGSELYLHRDHESVMRQRVTIALRSSPKTVAEIRDLLGTTRKFAVPFCEYLDRIGISRRDGDLRHLGPASPEAQS